MSTATLNIPRISADPIEPIGALAKELVTSELVTSGPDADVTEGELRDLLSGELTATEVNRLQRLVILDLMGRGLADREIRQRLKISASQYVRTSRGILATRMEDDQLDRLRTLERARINWTDKQATRRFRETGKPDFLRIRGECSDRRRKLDGLDKPPAVESHNTQQVSIRLNVITSREQFQSQQAEQARLNVLDVEALPPPPNDGGGNGNESVSPGDG